MKHNDPAIEIAALHASEAWTALNLALDIGDIDAARRARDALRERLAKLPDPRKMG